MALQDLTVQWLDSCGVGIDNFHLDRAVQDSRLAWMVDPLLQSHRPVLGGDPI